MHAARYLVAGRTTASISALLATLALLAGCVAPPASSPPSPASAKQPAAAPGVSGAPQMAATAHPLATRAALAMLERGGSAVDATIAAQMVLGLVESQSSGVGGGTFVLMWDEQTRRLSALDGLAAAPARVTASLRTDTDGQLLPSEPSQRGGRTVGVPGTVAVFAEAHRRAGRLPWAVLFGPAIEAAEQGFPMPRYMHAILALAEGQAARAQMAPMYYDDAGRLLLVGATVRNTAYAQTMRRLAAGGPGAFLADGAASRLVATAQGGFRPSLMTEADLRDYRPVEREPVCAPFLAWRVCTMSPPSFGGLAVLQTLQMVEARAGARHDFSDPAYVHLYAEAGKLAQADRRLWVGDPDFVHVPTAALAAPGYARERAQLIDPARAHPSPPAGRAGARVAGLVPDTGPTTGQTSQIAVADRQGNIVSVTTTNNLNFGARLAVDGFVLNNAMTNFSAAPRAGETLANQMAPRKRPVTSMAPTIVFDAQGRPVLAGGSAGGGPIVDYVATALIEMLANGRSPAQALALGHLSVAQPGKLQLEAGTQAAALAPALAARGHDVEQVPLNSGAAFIRRGPAGWVGAADPRRDGVAAGSVAEVSAAAGAAAR